MKNFKNSFIAFGSIAVLWFAAIVWADPTSSRQLPATGFRNGSAVYNLGASAGTYSLSGSNTGDEALGSPCYGCGLSSHVLTLGAADATHDGALLHTDFVNFSAVSAATASDTASTIVKRDASQQFAISKILDDSSVASVDVNGRTLKNTSGQINVNWNGANQVIFNQNAHTSPLTTSSYGFALNDGGISIVTIGADATNGYLQSWNNEPLLINRAGNDVNVLPNGFGTMNLGAPINMNSHRINNLTDPSSAQDAATKNYVDTGLSGKQATGNYVTAGIGDVTFTGPGSVATTIAAVQGTTVTGITGTNKVVFDTGPTISGPTVTGTLAGASETLSGTLAVTGATTLSSLTAGSVPYAGTAGLISQDNANMFYASGTSTLMLGATTTTTSLTGTHLLVASTGGTGIDIAAASNGAGANQANGKLSFLASGGTVASPTQTNSGATLGRVTFQGFNDIGAYDGTQVSFANIATEAHTSTAFGSKYTMSRVATGTSTLRSNSWVWDNDGAFYDASQTPATANYGLLSVGSTTAAPQGGWDGAAAGHYVGSANGTMLAANGQSGYTGDLLNLEVAGTSEFKVSSAGNTTVVGTLAVTGATTLSSTLAVNGAVAASNAAVVYKDGHLKSTQTTAPTATVNANAGTGATCAVSNATDTAGGVSLTTTAVAPASGIECTVNFNKTYGVAPKCHLQATNGNSVLQAVLSGIFTTTSTSQLIVNFANTDATGHAYTFDYLCVETQ